MKAQYFWYFWLFFLVTTQAEKLRFDNYTVYRITPNNQDDLNILKEWEYRGNEELNFWSPVTAIDSPVDLMVAPNVKSDIEKLIRLNGMKSVMLIKNVQDRIDNEGVRPVSRAGTFEWTYHWTLDEVSKDISLTFS